MQVPDRKAMDKSKAFQMITGANNNAPVPAMHRANASSIHRLAAGMFFIKNPHASKPTKMAAINPKIMEWGSRWYCLQRAYKTWPSKMKDNSHPENKENTIMDKLRASMDIEKDPLLFNSPTSYQII